MRIAPSTASSEIVAVCAPVATHCRHVSAPRKSPTQSDSRAATAWFAKTMQATSKRRTASACHGLSHPTNLLEAAESHDAGVGSVIPAIDMGTRGDEEGEHVPAVVAGRTATRDFVPPSEFDDYVILQELGRGQMGRVYLAEDAL